MPSAKSLSVLLPIALQPLWAPAHAFPVPPVSAYCGTDYVFLGEITNVELRRSDLYECQSTPLPKTMEEYEELENKNCWRLIYSAKVIRVIRGEKKREDKFNATNYVMYFQYTDDLSPQTLITSHITAMLGTKRIFPLSYAGGIFRKHGGYEWGLGYPRPAAEEAQALAFTDAVCQRHYEQLRQGQK